MPLPAGTGISRRAFVARSLGLALTVYGAGRLGIFEEGIAAASAGGQGRILVSVFLPGGADGMSMLYPDGDPLYRKLRPSLALSGRTGVHRGHTPLLASRALAAGSAALGGKGLGAAGGRLQPSRPVALHVPPLLGGRRHRPGPPHRLARPLSRRRRHARQPASGPLDDRPARAGARDCEGAGRRDQRSRPVHLLGSERVGQRPEPDARRGRRIRDARGERPGDADGGECRRPVGSPPPAAASVRRQDEARRARPVSRVERQLPGAPHRVSPR